MAICELDGCHEDSNAEDRLGCGQCVDRASGSTAGGLPSAAFFNHIKPRNLSTLFILILPISVGFSLGVNDHRFDF